MPLGQGKQSQKQEVYVQGKQFWSCVEMEELLYHRNTPIAEVWE